MEFNELSVANLREAARHFAPNEACGVGGIAHVGTKDQLIDFLRGKGIMACEVKEFCDGNKTVELPVDIKPGIEGPSVGDSLELEYESNSMPESKADTTTSDETDGLASDKQDELESELDNVSDKEKDQYSDDELEKISIEFTKTIRTIEFLGDILKNYSSITPRISDSLIISRSSPFNLTSEPDHLPNKTLSPTLTVIGIILPSSARKPSPTASTKPSLGFSLAVSGIMIPPAVFVFSSSLLIRTRSCNGLIFIVLLLPKVIAILSIRLVSYPKSQCQAVKAYFFCILRQKVFDNDIFLHNLYRIAKILLTNNQINYGTD